MSSPSARRPKWHPTPPPPPSPVLLRLPHGCLRRQHVATKTGENRRKVPLVLSDRSRTREREEEEKWRFQADVLRAECGLLRRERENAVMEMEKNKLSMEQTLRSALHIIGTKKCSGQCKMIVRKIMEQVREESKQWSEMQEMLGQVKKEMDQLKISRDFWQNRALQSEQQIQSLHSSAQEWKRKAVTFRSKAKLLKGEVDSRRRELSNYREVQKVEKTNIKDGPKLISLGAQVAKEKRELVYRMKEKENYRSASREFEQENLNNDGRRKSQIFDHGPVGLKRFPFQDIGNSASPKTRENGKKVLIL